MYIIFVERIDMDVKITLNVDEAILEKVNKYAVIYDISLSGLVELFLHEIASKDYKLLEDFPVSDWVKELSRGEPVYRANRKRIDRWP
jgi:hypothetical protein